MSRLDNLKEQNPDLNINLIDLLAKADPSGTYKYLPFIIKMFKSNFTTDEGILNHLFQGNNLINLQKFEEHSKANRIKNNDISTYNSFKQISDEVEKAEEMLRIKELEKQVKKIYNDDDWMVLIPLSFESAKMYGANTKWCITQEKYWHQYIAEYKIFYIINKKRDLKWAISSKDSESKIEGWQADDNPINPFMIPMPSSIIAVITDEIRMMDSISDMPEYRDIQSKNVEQFKTWKETSISEIATEYFGEDISSFHNNMGDIDVQTILGIMGKLGMMGSDNRIR